MRTIEVVEKKQDGSIVRRTITPGRGAGKGANGAPRVAVPRSIRSTGVGEVIARAMAHERRRAAAY